MHDTFDDQLNQLTDDQLIDVYINYKKYNYPDTAPDCALKILKNRNVPHERIKLLQEKYLIVKHEIKQKKEELAQLSRDYFKAVIIAFALYTSFLLLNIVHFLIYRLIDDSLSLIIAVFMFINAIISYIFYALAINKHIIFLSVSDNMDANKLSNIFYFSIGYAVAPFSLIFIFFQMKKAIRKLDGNNS